MCQIAMRVCVCVAAVSENRLGGGRGAHLSMTWPRPPLHSDCTGATVRHRWCLDTTMYNGLGPVSPSPPSKFSVVWGTALIRCQASMCRNRN